MADRQPVLILARHEIIAALIGTLVDLAGHQPWFAEPTEPPAAAIERVRPALVLLEASQRAARDDGIYCQAATSGSVMVLFSSELELSDFERLADRHGVGSFTLPIGYHAFGDVLSRALESAA